VEYTVDVPDDAASGDYDLSVTASTEGEGGVSATDETTITVEQSPNQPPTIDAIDDQTVTEGDSATVSVSTDDPDGDSVSLSLTQAPDFVTLSDGEITLAPESGDAGAYTVEVTADDGNGGTATESFQVTVEEPPNQPPTIDAISDQTVTEGDSATVPVNADDPDGDSVSLSVSGPDFVSLSDGELTIAPQDGDAGAYTVDVTADDGTDQTAESFQLTVEEPPNEEPTAAFDASPTDPNVGEDVTFDASASEDSDGSIESYEWDFGDGETATGEQVTHAFDDAGDYDVELEVEDDDGVTDTVTETITVSEAPNEGPTAAFDASPADPEVGEDVTLDASDSDDSDGEIDSYEWTITPPGGESEETLLDSDFEEGSLSDAGWSHDAIEGSADAGVSDATSNSGSYSAYHLGGEGALVSPGLDASVADAVEVSYWIQKGSEEFSENPDANAGEDVVVEYLDDEGDWVEVDRVEDTVEPGTEITETLTLSEDALHDGLQIRFRQQGASVSDGDYWHVDDVSVTAASSGSEPMTMTGETVTFTPSTAGDYDVSLTVADDDSATDSTTQTVTASDADDELSILEAVAGEDGEFSTTEIQQAIDLWVEDEPVPDTGGETIDTQTMQQLIDAWAEDESVSEIGGDA
jgi:PKD repeat protein